MAAAVRPHAGRDGYKLRAGGLADDAGCCILASPATAGCGNLAASAAAGLARQRSVLARLIAAVDPSRSDELAERLLREFHSLSRIWSQSPEALSRILGADSAVATLLIGARDMMVEGMRGDLRAKEIGRAHV